MLCFRLICLLLPLALPGQVTIVPGALNDTFELSVVELSVRDIAVVKGRTALTGNMQPDKKVVNLLHWRYFDTFLGRNAIYPNQLLTQPCTQLVDEIEDEEFVSLNIVLDGRDSADCQFTFLLQLAGLQKWQLDQAPLRGLSDADPEAPQRFSAIVRVRPLSGAEEAYDSLDGQLEIEAFDVKKQTIRGSFYFEANRIGQHKRGSFQNGRF